LECTGFSLTSKEMTMRKKRKIFPTREERDAWVARMEAHERELRRLVERGQAELAAKQKPA
jgi:hypothetical protein